MLPPQPFPDFVFPDRPTAPVVTSMTPLPNCTRPLCSNMSTIQSFSTNPIPMQRLGRETGTHIRTGIVYEKNSKVVENCLSLEYCCCVSVNEQCACCCCAPSIHDYILLRKYNRKCSDCQHVRREGSWVQETPRNEWATKTDIGNKIRSGYFVSIVRFAY